MRDRFAMPLPKSILCTACKRTYPEGWRRCPYCGHDELRTRQDAPARKYMARKVQEFEQKMGVERKEGRREGGRPPRPDSRPQTGQSQTPGQPQGRREPRESRQQSGQRQASAQRRENQPARDRESRDNQSRPQGQKSQP